MALIHQAELRPSKIELLQEWAPNQAWFEGSAGASLTSVASFRFDDPEGEVGIETIFVTAGDGPAMQIPLTYRGAPLEGGDAWLIGTMQHSVLGRRWVYDATGDAAYLAAVVTAALTGVGQAEQYIAIDGELVRREPTAVIVASGKHGTPVPPLPAVGAMSVRHEHGATVVEAGDIRLLILRVPSRESNDDAALGVLTGAWTDQPEPQALVIVQVLAN